MNSLEFEHLGFIKEANAYGGFRGICGDEIEFSLVIEDNFIKDIKFCTTGCDFTKKCGEAVASEAEGKNLKEALGINPKYILETIKGLPENHTHCTILAVTALYKAIANYLWKRS